MSSEILTENSQGFEGTIKGFDDYELKLGDVLRGERATLGKSLMDVQRELRIRASYVSAIEDCNTGAFETKSFVAGYVKSYAKYLGLPPEDVYSKFCKESGFTARLDSPTSKTAQATQAFVATVTGPSAKPVDPIFSNTTTAFVATEESFFERFEARAVGSMLVLVMLIAALGYGGWKVLGQIQQINVLPADVTPIAMSDIDPVQQSIPTQAGFDPNLVAGGANDKLDRLYRPSALDEPIFSEGKTTIATVNINEYGNYIPHLDDKQGASTTASYANIPLGPFMQVTLETEMASPVVVDEGPSPVTLFVSRDAWVRVKSPDGTTLFEQVMKAGDEYTVPMLETPATLHAGMAGSIFFAVDGELYGPAGKGAGVVKNILLGAKEVNQSYSLANFERDKELTRVASRTDVSSFTLDRLSE